VSQKYILEVDILDKIELLREYMLEKKYWCSFNYLYFLNRVDDIIALIKKHYFEHTFQDLKDVLRQIAANTFDGDIPLFVEYFNAWLYVLKLRQKVLYHQKYGNFPEF